jgi:hypothetical protein
VLLFDWLSLAETKARYMNHFLRQSLGLALLLVFAIPNLAAQKTIDDRINEAMEPVTTAISKVIFFDIAINEEIEVARKERDRDVFKMVVDQSAPEVVLGENKKAIKNVSFFVSGQEDGKFSLAYELIANDDTLRKQLNALLPNETIVLDDFNGATLALKGDPSEFVGQQYRVRYQSVRIPFVLIWLIIGAVFFTVFFRFINISGFKHALNVVRGKYDNPNHSGEVSHFQALTAALSGTVGIGNIAGVAVAVSIGGPGATFWMIVAGLLGMSTKFVECTLGVKYRRKNPDGSVSGGPMYYLSHGLAKKGFGKAGKVLAIF